MEKPILEYVIENIEDGVLPYGFNLDQYRRHDRILFLDGAEDSIVYFHSPGESDEELCSYIVEKVMSLKTSEDLRKTFDKLEKFFEGYEGIFIATIDSIRKQINESLNYGYEQLVFLLGSMLINEGSQINSVKLGIMIVGMYDLENHGHLLEKLKSLALCDEFTVYVNAYIFENLRNANDLRFELARKMYGWGKIYLTLSLKNSSEEINDWLITDGCDNLISSGYLAAEVIGKINLKKLFDSRLNGKQIEGLCNIMDGLIFDTPLSDLTELSSRDEIIRGFVSLAPLARDITHYYTCMVDLYMWCDSVEENDAVIETRKQIEEFFDSEDTYDFVSEILLDCDSYVFESLMNLIQLSEKHEYHDLVMERFLRNPVKAYGAIDYLMSREKYKESVEKRLKEPNDFSAVSGLPEDNHSFSEMSLLLEKLAPYPFLGQQYVVAGLKSRLSALRNEALNVIDSWLEIDPEKTIIEYPDEIYDALKWLNSHEVVDAHKVRVGEILGENSSIYIKKPVS